MPELPQLDPLEQRVLGSLLEKEVTVPTTYPLSLNALRTACNQTSSRDPVSDYDELLIEQTARGLKDRELIRIVWSDTGRRTLKYHQTLAERLDAGCRRAGTPHSAAAARCPGARTSSGRAPTGCTRSPDAARSKPACSGWRSGPHALVRELERRAGQHDNRWVHLLGPVDTGEATQPTQPAVDRDVVLAEGTRARDERIRRSYNAVASSYADHLFNELTQLPFESWLLRRVVDLAQGHPVIEVGCGTGHVTDFLAGEGADAMGLDLAPGMIEVARSRYPERRFEVGDLNLLVRPVNDAGWGAVLAWYSLVHAAASELPTSIAALSRPLRPGGWLVVALHAGAEVRHLDQWWDIDVELDFVLHDPVDVRAAAEAAGLVDLEWYHRGPLTAREETTERYYLLARKPD